MEKDHNRKSPGTEACDRASCPACKNCRAVRQEEEGPEKKGSSFQLYAKEAEHYFFYYSAYETNSAKL